MSRYLTLIFASACLLATAPTGAAAQTPMEVGPPRPFNQATISGLVQTRDGTPVTGAVIRVWLVSTGDGTEVVGDCVGTVVGEAPLESDREGRFRYFAVFRAGPPWEACVHLEASAPEGGPWSPVVSSGQILRVAERDSDDTRVCVRILLDGPR
jgi:hypothetical protein